MSIKIVIIVTVLLCIINIKCEIEERLKKDFFSIYKNIALEAKDLTNQHVSPNQIRYFMFTKNRPMEYTEINPDDPTPLDKYLNTTIVFIIHGWTGNRENQWYEDLKNAFLLRQENYVVVQVDWSEPANQFYTISSWNTMEVGGLIGEFIVDLNQNYSIPLANFLFIGHSLGAHVSGFIGKKVQELTGGQKLPRIIALDPAGPLFSTRPEAKRLNKNDAEVVVALHTDGGTFGFKQACGTIDIYPNGGNLQPGCTRIDLLDITSVAEPVVCDHQRSWQLFIEAILNPTALKATKCGGWAQFKTNLCEKIELALGDLKSKVSGAFYLSTNREKPFTKRRGDLRVDDIIQLAATPLKLF